MRIAAKMWLAALMTSGALLGREARATTDLQTLHDARSIAMGGTGSSFIENGASVYLNPAALDGIESFTATAAIAPVKQENIAPLTMPNNSVTSDTPIFPMFLAGAGFRLSERFVAAIAIYPTSRFGATYTNAVNGEDVSLKVTQLEAAPAVSYKLLDNLSLGLSYRITYTAQSEHRPSATGPVDVSLDGTNFFGIQAGVYFRPLEMLHLALTYRSRVDTNLSGTTETGGVKSDTSTSFNAPNAFRLGASVATPIIPLIVAADIKYQLYADSNQSADLTTNSAAGPVTTTRRLDWMNSLTFGLGAELTIISILSIRAGYSYSQSATPETTANPFATPPGEIHAVHFGVGVKIPLVDVGLGGMYAFSSKTLAANPAAPTVVPGTYELSTAMVGASATLHM
jgi:long-chain fatty acid transport protein